MEGRVFTESDSKKNEKIVLKLFYFFVSGCGNIKSKTFLKNNTVIWVKTQRIQEKLRK